MKKVSLLVGLMLIMAVMSGCAEFGRSNYRSSPYGYGSSSGGGHSSH